MRLRGGRMIVNPVRYVSGGAVKTKEVTLAAGYSSTKFVYLNENMEAVTVNVSYRETIVAAAQSLIAVHGSPDWRNIVGASQVAKLSDSGDYVYQVDT